MIPKYSLLDHVKYISSTLGWIAGPCLFLTGIANLDVPYAGLLLLFGVLVWWLAAGISYSLSKEREVREKENASIDQ